MMKLAIAACIAASILATPPAIAQDRDHHLRVVLGEEPWLARTHGATWDDYTKRVRRWL
jgi:protein-S-isoprenylcysteine O-methyltransferase Ste14